MSAQGTARFRSDQAFAAFGAGCAEVGVAFVLQPGDFEANGSTGPDDSGGRQQA